MKSQWRLKTPVSRLFTPLFVQVQIKENTKATRHWPLWRESTGYQWISPHNGPVTREMFPFDDVVMNANLLWDQEEQTSILIDWFFIGEITPICRLRNSGHFDQPSMCRLDSLGILLYDDC